MSTIEFEITGELDEDPVYVTVPENEVKGMSYEEACEYVSLKHASEYASKRLEVKAEEVK